MAFFSEFFDAFEEGFEFGAGKRGVGGIDERGVAADLAEAEEAGEDVEPNLTKAEASKRIDELQEKTGRGKPGRS